ncbi:MAG: hypothetical protein KJ749_03760 [Planctomycetes bacterium]|nr:hypothetical protein [Planctomycetota bacterium]
MPGATAGAPNGPHVVVALASTGQVHEQTLGSVQKMIRATRRAASIEMWWQSAYPGGHCRNLLVERFLASPDKTHLLFVDTDMVVPEQGIDLLLETRQPLVCGPAPVCRRHETGPASGRARVELTTNILDINDPAFCEVPPAPEAGGVSYKSRPHDTLPDDLFTCDASGMSLCLVAREVLERMEPPWFYFVDLPDRSTVGHDVYFFRKVRQLGYQLAVHPEAWCDHIKVSDLTRIEELLGAGMPQSRWNRMPTGPTPRTMVLACTSRRWLDLRTAETLIRWQEEPGSRIGVRLFEATETAWALTRWLNGEEAKSDTWERIMLVGPDVVPAVDLIHRLGSVGAPIVSPLSRSLINGQIAYNFARRDPSTMQTEYPTQLSLAEITEPFEACTVDTACCVIHCDVCQHAVTALAESVSQPNPTRAFDERFCDLVRKQTGRDPMVAPVFVERSADIGLSGLLRLKQKLQADQQTQVREDQPQTCHEQPVGIA